MKLAMYLLVIILLFASTVYSQVLIQESFEDSLFPPANWTETIVESAGYGTDPNWYRFEGTDLSPYNTSYLATAHEGDFLACFNSRIASGWCASSRLESPAVDLSQHSSANLSYWMFHDTAWGWGDCWEAITVQVDPGTGVWENLGEMNVRQVSDDPGWSEMILSLDDYVGLSAVRIGFLAVSDQGENINLDLISVSALDTDAGAPQLLEFAGTRMPVAASLDFSILMSDRSQGAEELQGLLSFDGFSTSVTFSLQLQSEASPVLPMRRFRYMGAVPAPGFSGEGQVRILLNDVHGNQAWTDDLAVDWYHPLWEFSEDFESQPDFSLEIPPFTQIDGDSSGTWGISYSTFPNNGYVGSFIVFNPDLTDPPSTFAGYQPHSGERCAVAFTAFNGNDDWLVSPAIAPALDLKFSFWARTPDTSWDLERFRVMVSTTDNHNPESFELVPSEHYLAGEDYIEPPFAWTRYEFDLSPWAAGPNDYVFVAINGVSPWITLTGLFVDDLEFVGTYFPAGAQLPVPVSRPKAYPNPFNPSTTIAFDLALSSSVDLSIHNLRGRLVKSLVAEVRSAGHHEVVWTGTNNNGKPVGSGTYLVQLLTNEGMTRTKIVLVK